jgi:hypothetical protein
MPKLSPLGGVLPRLRSNQYSHRERFFVPALRVPLGNILK